MTLNLSHPAFSPPVNEASDNVLEWHQDCLTVTVLLASSLDKKSQQKLLKRVGCIEESRQKRPELLLHALHEACHLKPEARAAVTKKLDSKFGTTANKIKKMTDQEIVEQAQQSPWLIPLVWGCYRHDCGLVRKTGRHLAHLAVLQGMKQLRGKSLLLQERERNGKLCSQNNALRQSLAEVQKDNQSLTLQLSTTSTRPPVPIRPALPADQPYKKQIKKLRQELADKQLKVKDLQQKVAVWRSMALRSERDDAGVGTAPAFPADQIPRGACGQPCGQRECRRQSHCLLKGQRVAVIGGLERLEASYRQVIESMGGNCLCHTGNVSSGAHRLRQIVNKSDIVVFLTPINSHGAMSVVKKQCKRCKTPFCPLNGTGASALESHLKEISDIFLAA